MSRPPNRNRDEHRRARTADLVEAAVAVIRRDGPSAASMDRIAAHVGVTRPILYRYFGDRDGLAKAIGQRFVDGLLAELRVALGAEASPRDLLSGTIDTYLAFVERDPEIYRYLVHGPHAFAQQHLTGFIGQIGSEVAVVLGEQLRAAGVDSGAAEPWAHGLVGMVHQAGDWWIERRSMPRSRLVAYLTALAWDGMDRIATTGEVMA